MYHLLHVCSGDCSESFSSAPMRLRSSRSSNARHSRADIDPCGFCWDLILRVTVRSTVLPSICTSQPGRPLLLRGSLLDIAPFLCLCESHVSDLHRCHSKANTLESDSDLRSSCAVQRKGAAFTSWCLSLLTTPRGLSNLAFFVINVYCAGHIAKKFNDTEVRGVVNAALAYILGSLAQT